jgi:hypothetical protein
MTQVALTSLSLPSLSQTHWVARAFFVISLISGALSVYYAVMSQKIVGSLFDADEIRAWLTRPLPTSQLTLLRESEQLILAMDPGSDGQPQATTKGPESQQTDRLPVTVEDGLLSENFQAFRQDMLTLQAPSLASTLTLATPVLMLNVSLGTLLLALGIYLGFVWTRDLDTMAGLHDSRDVFIFYMIGTFAMIIFYYVPVAKKEVDMEKQTYRLRVMKLMDKLTTIASAQRSQRAQASAATPREVPNQTGEHKNNLVSALQASIQAQEASLEANRRLVELLRGDVPPAPHSPSPRPAEDSE